MTGPLTQVLDAFEGGAGSLVEVSSRTGLSRDVVAASVDHLLRLGRLEARELALGCPSGGCRACPSGTASGAAGCGTPAPPPASTTPAPGRRSGGLVALTLTRRSPRGRLADRGSI